MFVVHLPMYQLNKPTDLVANHIYTRQEVVLDVIEMQLGQLIKTKPDREWYHQ